MKKTLWLSLTTIISGGISWANAQFIPVPEIVPPHASAAAPAQEPISESQAFRQRWTLVAQSFRDMEVNPDYADGFLVSRELRSCQCTRPDPWAVLRGLDEGQTMAGGTDAQLRCGFCMVQKYTQWQERISRQCGLLLTLSPFEVERLEKSEDAQGLPARCFERARAMRPAAAVTTQEALQPKIHGTLVQRKEDHRYLRVIAGPACLVGLEGTSLQFGTKDWLEIPPNVTQLRLRSSCQATAEIYRGTKAEFEKVERLNAEESSLIRWERR